MKLKQRNVGSKDIEKKFLLFVRGHEQNRHTLKSLKQMQNVR